MADYLKVARSVQCDADQIIITEGIHQAIDLVSRALSDIGDRVWIEDPAYWGCATRSGLTSGYSTDARRCRRHYS